MTSKPQIPNPLLFNPLKHHLKVIKEFLSKHILPGTETDDKTFYMELKHLGSSVMDIYTGDLTSEMICNEVIEFLKSRKLLIKESFSAWTGMNINAFRIILLSDSSQWTLKYHNSSSNYVHLFPARYSPHTFRIKSNTLKTAMLYLNKFGNREINEEDLNKVNLWLTSPLLSLWMNQLRLLK